MRGRQGRLCSGQDFELEEWIPAFAGMTKHYLSSDREVVLISDKGNAWSI
jgi:hypothetical protein